jgi:REP element-mobilizing transposase RayT
MARKLRIQFEGAIYHVINRGNYRRDIFEDPRAIQAFERCLFEAAEQFGWQFHAYALMRNHYHLALETPRTNLPEGMQWLQSSFATCFNRIRREQGHLFQGRYRAILVEAGPCLARVVNYIHLNPVSAGIVAVEQLPGFRWTSLRYFMGRERPTCLVCEEWLRELHLSDSSGDWLEYVKYLGVLACNKSEQERQDFGSLDVGWAVGTHGWKKALAEDRAHLSLSQFADAAANAELKHLQWAKVLGELLVESKKTAADIAEAKKGVPWKIAVAAALRRKTTATNSWIARELNMGAASSVRQYLSDERRGVRAG